MCVYIVCMSIYMHAYLHHAYMRARMSLCEYTYIYIYMHMHNEIMKGYCIGVCGFCI